MEKLCHIYKQICHFWEFYGNNLGLRFYREYFMDTAVSEDFFPLC